MSIVNFQTNSLHSRPRGSESLDFSTFLCARFIFLLHDTIWYFRSNIGIIRRTEEVFHILDHYYEPS